MIKSVFYLAVSLGHDLPSVSLLTELLFPHLFLCFLAEMFPTYFLELWPLLTVVLPLL